MHASPATASREMYPAAILDRMKSLALSDLESNSGPRPYAILALQGVKQAERVITLLVEEEDSPAPLIKSVAERALANEQQSFDDPLAVMRYADLGYSSSEIRVSAEVLDEKSSSEWLRGLAERFVESGNEGAQFVPDSTILLEQLRSRDCRQELDEHYLDPCGGNGGGDERVYYYRAKAAAILLRAHQDDPRVVEALIDTMLAKDTPSSLADLCAWSLGGMKLDAEHLSRIEDVLLRAEGASAADLDMPMFWSLKQGPKRAAYVLNQELLRHQQSEETS